MFYILSLILMILIYVAIIFLMPKFKHKKVVNIIFCCITFSLYIINEIIIYNDVGFYDWNFQNTLPVANVSPFMFAIMPLYFILPKKIKKYYLTLISLLFVGMFLSPCFNCIYFASITYKFHFHFLLDYIAHFSLSLWGIYLVKSKQIELKAKDCVISGAFIVGVALTMMILNVIFNTSFFGLSLNGKHNIYNLVLVKNSYLSLLIYFFGLICVLFCGYFANNLINFQNNKK